MKGSGKGTTASSDYSVHMERGTCSSPHYRLVINTHSSISTMFPLQGGAEIFAITATHAIHLNNHFLV